MAAAAGAGAGANAGKCDDHDAKAEQLAGDLAVFMADDDDETIHVKIPCRTPAAASKAVGVCLERIAALTKLHIKVNAGLFVKDYMSMSDDQKVDDELTLVVTLADDITSPAALLTGSPYVTASLRSYCSASLSSACSVELNNRTLIRLDTLNVLFTTMWDSALVKELTNACVRLLSTFGRNKHAMQHASRHVSCLFSFVCQAVLASVALAHDAPVLSVSAILSSSQ